ncbi:MAG TPA: hypothetical protein VF533_19840 [Solirubrobacteraceae bacterium]|jgi:uncharacterized membrane protein YfcA
MDTERLNLIIGVAGLITGCAGLVGTTLSLLVGPVAVVVVLAFLLGVAIGGASGALLSGRRRRTQTRDEPSGSSSESPRL